MGRQYFTSRHIPIEENFRYTVQSPNFNRARWISEKILEQYQNGELDEIHVIYTRMENSMQSVPEDERLLPIRRPCLTHIPADVYQEEFFMIPSPEEAVDTIIPNYITGFIYGALVQAFYTVHNARMIAMEAATNNADELLRDLKVMYNRARQAAITQEITEVCSGAKAQRAKKDAQK